MSIDHIWTVLLGAVLALVTDTLFMGLLFRERYGRYPGVWQEPGGKPWLMPVALLLILVSAIAFVWLAVQFGRTDWAGASLLAFAIWLAGPLPLVVANGVVINIDPRVTVAHAVGWLVKLLMFAASAALLLS